MSDQADLSTFADDCGTTDDIREGVELNPPEDGHLRRVNEVHDYWHGLVEYADGHYNSHSMVPPGKFTIVLDVDHVDRGWPNGVTIEPGVWLSGKARQGSLKPPVPVAVDDAYLQFAAEACLLAAKKVITDGRVVALSTSLHETLSIGVTSEAYDYQETLFNGGSLGGVPDREGTETRHGFFHIRKMGTPFSLYTDAEVPRLSLDDLRVDIPERWSP